MTLIELRNRWIEAENARTDAYRSFMDANRASPLRMQLDAASEAEKKAKEAYAAALQQQNASAPNGNDED